MRRWLSGFLIGFTVARAALPQTHNGAGGVSKQRTWDVYFYQAAE